MDINYAFGVVAVVFVVLELRVIIGFINALSKARAAGGIKLYIRKPLAVIHIVLLAVVAVLCAKQFSQAAERRRSIEEYELLKTSAGYGDYLKDAIAERDGVNITDPQKYIENYIAKLKSNAEDYTFMGVMYAVFALFNAAYLLNTIWFFTDEGVIFALWKSIEPVTAVRDGGHILVNVSVQLKNGSTLLVVKDDPKNLARFGRYIKWEIETEETTEEIL